MACPHVGCLHEERNNARPLKPFRPEEGGQSNSECSELPKLVDKSPACGSLVGAAVTRTSVDEAPVLLGENCFMAPGMPRHVVKLRKLVLMSGVRGLRGFGGAHRCVAVMLKLLSKDVVWS